MLEMMDIGIDKAVACRWGGKITEDEMKLIFSALKEKIDKYGKIHIYQEIESFGGVKLDAVIEEFKFLFDVGLAHFDKAAVVTNKKWVHKLVDLEDKIFRKIEMKSFSTDERQEAIEFLRSD
jgi:RNA binding exosome subunit